MIMGGDLLQGHFMRQQQQSTNKSSDLSTHSINMLTAGMTSEPRRSGRTSSSTKPAGTS